MKRKVKLSDYLRKHWLLVAIIGCIFVAGIFPWLGSKEGAINNRKITYLNIEYN